MTVAQLNQWYPPLCSNPACAKGHTDETHKFHRDAFHLKIVTHLTQNAYLIEVRVAVNNCYGMIEDNRMMGLEMGEKSSWGASKPGNDSGQVRGAILSAQAMGRLSVRHEKIFLDRKTNAMVCAFFQRSDLSGVLPQTLMPTVLVSLIQAYLGTNLLETLHKPLFDERYQWMRTVTENKWPEPPLTIIQKALS